MDILSVVILIWTSPAVDGYQTDYRRYEYPCEVMEKEMKSWLDYGEGFGLKGDFFCLNTPKT